MKQNYFAILGVAAGVGVASFGAYKTYQGYKQRSTFDAICSNHVIAWGMARVSNSSMAENYRFGPNEAEMLSELSQFRREYIDTGKDTLKEMQVQWVKEYTPGYLNACTAYYMGRIGECDGISNKDELSVCLGNLDASYQAMVGAIGIEHVHEKKPWDLSSTSLEKMERAHRRLLAGELSK